VKLREYSVRSLHDQVFSWPPLWTGVKEKGHHTLTGEIGTLRYVYANQVVWTKCYLVIEHERENYVGCLFFTSHNLSKQIISLLQRHIGQTIKEIGNLDIF
jgi:hypothetical protein